MWVFSVDHNQKKTRFDRLHGRKVSTFFPQMVMGGQQKRARVLLGSASLIQALSLSRFRVKRP